MSERKNGFTLVEILISSVILVSVIGLVFATLVTTFNSWRRAEEASIKQQQVRFLFFRMNRELSSAVRNGKFAGDGSAFHFITALMPMAEIGYEYNGADKTLTRSFEKTADLNFDTFDRKDQVMSGLQAWRVSFLDSGGQWQEQWLKDELPRAVKIAFKIDEKTPEQENIVHIAVAE
ncbi:MAG: type II secretion system protein GspJ [Candidatus Omnitrophica bacterium]|nr:type II secretion system protein GspJ [Candidatus Omnitrophota bacterium]